MPSEKRPKPKSRGSRVPPGGRPPGGAGTETPDPPPPRRPRARASAGPTTFAEAFESTMTEVMEEVGQVADAIAGYLGLRAARRE